MLLVIGIGALLAGLTMPIGWRFYQLQVANETVAGFQNSFRSAQSNARLAKNDRSFGVKLFADQYVLFQGGTYVSRDLLGEEIFPFPSGETIASTTSEVVFAKVSGLPSATSTITLTLFGRSHTLTIGDAGVITQIN